VGIAGIVVGSVFGLVAHSTYDGAKADCLSVPDDCSNSAVDKSNTAHAQAAVSTVAFVAGGVLAATGVVLYLSAPHATVAIRPIVGFRSAGLGVGGGF
jgi:hypothetical protein